MDSAQLRAWLTGLGIGMGILWLASLGSPEGAGWLGWLDFVAAVLSFAGAASTTTATEVRVRSGGTIALAAGIFALWLGGLLDAGNASWLVWWNFAFACAYLILGIAAGTGRGRREQRSPLRRAA